MAPSASAVSNAPADGSGPAKIPKPEGGPTRAAFCDRLEADRHLASDLPTVYRLWCFSLQFRYDELIWCRVKHVVLDARTLTCVFNVPIYANTVCDRHTEM